MKTREALLAPRPLGSAALAGVVVFAVVAAAMQWVRSDLDWMRTPLSFYLLDPHGDWLQAAYLALATGLLSLGVGWYLALSREARSAAPLLLFVAAGLALATTALAETGRPGQEPTMESLVHGIAAQAAFLCLTVAMMLQAWRLRGDARWRHRFGAAFAVALAAFAGLWILVLWRDAPRGLLQKAEIALIVVWLGAAASWLRRGPRTAGVPELPGESGAESSSR